MAMFERQGWKIPMGWKKSIRNHIYGYRYPLNSHIQQYGSSHSNEMKPKQQKRMMEISSNITEDITVVKTGGLIQNPLKPIKHQYSSSAWFWIKVLGLFNEANGHMSMKA